jgi:hypothetical protein
MVHEFHGGDEMTKRSKKATKSSKRSKVAMRPVKQTRAATKSTAAVQVIRSETARSHIAEGTRLFALAGRPTKAQFIKVYGPKGPKMTWAQRAEAGVDAKHFQAALAAKGGS